MKHTILFVFLFILFVVTDLPTLTVANGKIGGRQIIAQEPVPLYWVGPMDPNYRRDRPGLDPMGMALVPVYANTSTITVSPSVQQNLGVRTETVRREDFSRDIRAVGNTRWDESTIEMLHPRAEGWLEEFTLASVGDVVRRGDLIYSLFSPKLVSTQAEYLTVKQAGNVGLIAGARERLGALGFSTEQIEQLDTSGQTSSRLGYLARQDAIVTHIGVRAGAFVEPQTAIATLASLDSVWIDAQIFEADAGAVTVGSPVTLSFQAYPGEFWQSEVAYIYPELEVQTRSLRFRSIVANPGHRLKPNMFADVSVQSLTLADVLTIPREAVIRSGQGARVIRALGEGKFEPVAVVTGMANASRIVVISGLAEGDTVVSSGQFLLDSEANGEQAMARLAALEPQDANSNATAPAVNADNTPTAVTTTYATTGTITAANSSMITISHQPVPALDWPAMMMGFQVPQTLDASAFRVGDRVRFEFIQLTGGMYQLQSIARETTQ